MFFNTDARKIVVSAASRAAKLSAAIVLYYTPDFTGLPSNVTIIIMPPCEP